MSRFNALCLLGTLGLGAGCAVSPKASLVATTSAAAATCNLAVEVENNTEAALNVYWTALNRSGPAIRVGHVGRGKTTIGLPETVTSRIPNGGSYFFSRRLTRDKSLVDERKLNYQTACM